MKKRIIAIIAVVAVIALLGVVLAACAPKDLEAAKEKMDKAGYSNLAYDGGTVTGSDGAFIAVKSTSDRMTAIHFTSNTEAEAYYERNEDNANMSNLTLQGKWVYWGSKAAVKAFEK